MTNEQHAQILDTTAELDLFRGDNNIAAALRAGAAALMAPKPYAVLTEAQAVKLFNALFSMGHAVVPGMPIAEDVARACCEDAADVILEVEMPNIAEAIIRHGAMV